MRRDRFCGEVKVQINKHVHAIKIPFSVTTPAGVVMERFVYVYLIYARDGICLVDTGIASSEETIFDYIRKTDRKVNEISLIVHTHSHPDHIGASKAIKGETGCAVAVHPAEKAWVEDVQLQARERPVPGFDTLVAGSMAVNMILGDGDVIDLGCSLKAEVIHTPGHSKGSISLLLHGYNVLFSGDAVPVAGEMPVYEDVTALVASVKRLKRIPDIKHFLASWDDPLQGEEAYRRIDEGLEWIQRIHEAVIKCSGNGFGTEPIELCKRVFAELGLPPQAANPIAARSCAAHMAVRGQRTVI